MKIYYDTEFLEGRQDKRFLGVKCGETKPTIDLISIGMISEDNREYYAISKDFNLKEAWNRYDLVHEQTYGDMRNHFPEGITKKVYWIRENVLRPIFEELVSKYVQLEYKANQIRTVSGYNPPYKFNYKTLKLLIHKFGKSNKQIAEEVFQFVSGDSLTIEKAKFYNVQYKKAELYGYYSSFDHCCLAWLFGKMIDLPNGFPMLTYDLKQEFDRKQNSRNKLKEVIGESEELFSKYETHSLIEPLNLKEHPDYPKQENLHSAIHDARWNKQFHQFLEKV